ncbi:hypothetical protein [Rhodopila sp.]|uniref:hypothetical protein n=1 Tax=Rhodopila sp. TaxID=2480087 RepID=UPI003D0BBACA
MSYLFSALGAAVTLAAGDKLVGMRAYEGMFRHLGWSRGEMQAAAAAEMAGGLLMMPHSTRRIGGALLAASSAAVLASEISHGDTKLALPRGLILLAALAAAAGVMRPA